MNISELRAELSMKTLEFERALDKGSTQNDIFSIYRNMKELQYQITLLESNQPRPAGIDLTIE